MFFFHFPAQAAAGPEIVGEAAVLMDIKNGQVLYEKNLHQKIYPASTTKTLTAVVALENGRLDDLVTIQKEDCNIEGSAIGLQEGERITMEDLLYALMLNSGNDTAVAIARHVGGSVENFVRMMNEKAAELGALNTHFNNPNGLPDPDHYSTAYDMALISRYAMLNPEFRKIVSTKVKTIHRDDPEAQTFLENHNRLLWRYEGAIGVKTGYTVEARQCLVAAAGRQGRELLSVVMKSEGNNIWTDATGLLDYGFKEFQLVSLTAAGRYVTDAPVRFGEAGTVPVQTGSSLAYNFPAGKQPGVRQEVILRNGIAAPVKAGEKLGELVFFAGDRELGRVDLLAQREVKRRLSAQGWPWLFLAAGLLVMAAVVRYHSHARRRRWERFYRRKYYL
ncbi:MAG: D-alanyl-D-alanine carboxypeptidase [Peptococcaceae bacterium]|nr:D-alanyl-D-alanine carboxypeptidase [Peptococcaceae bacterium]